MRHLKWVALGLLVLGPGARAFAQQTDTTSLGRCTLPDSIAVTGNHRVSDADVRAASGLVAGLPGNAKTAQDAVRNLFETGQFDDVRVECTVPKGGQHAVWQVSVSERPILELVRVVGTNRLSEKTVSDLIDLTPGRPLQAGDVVRSTTRIDSAYQNAGYYLAKVTVDSSTTTGARR